MKYKPCKLIYLLLTIKEIFPSSLANLVNKLVYAHSFVYLICNSLGKYIFPVFLTEGGLVSVHSQVCFRNICFKYFFSAFRDRCRGCLWYVLLQISEEQIKSVFDDN